MKGNFQLCPRDVQEIRAMFRHAFTHRTIAEAYGVAIITVQDIIQGRAWTSLPTRDVPLPVLQPEAAVKLRLRSFHRLSDALKAALKQYRQQLAAHIELSAEREGYAIGLLDEWRPKRPHHKHAVHKLAAVAA